MIDLEKFSGGGLLPTPKEKMKFSFGAVFGYPDPATLPNEFDIGEPLEIKNQNIPSPSFICVAESLVSVSEFQEKVALEPAFILKLITQISETIQWIYQGTNLEIGAKAALKGFLERQESPYSVEKDGVEVSATPNNWNASYDKIAQKHKKQAYYWIGVSGKLNMWDAIRGAMYQFKDEKRAVQAGVIWNSEWTDKTYIDAIGTPAYGHAIAVLGWKGDYLKIQNSLGKEIGENGIQYFHKDIVNKEFGKFKALAFSDMPFSEEEILKKSKSYRIGLIGVILDFIKRVLGLMSEEIKTLPPAPIVPPAPVIPPTPPVPPVEVSKYDFGNPEAAKKSVALICDEEKLSPFWKERLLATMNHESGFKPRAEHINTDNSKDCGIAQFSERYYLKEYKMTCEEAKQQPEKCSRIMARNFKNGRASNWNSYKYLYPQG